jgi:DNA-directed RNA polymerase subunit H (RpoH/RPB5)
MTDAYYEQYKNIYVFGEMRKYDTKDPLISKDAFRKAIQLQQYIRIGFINKLNGNPVYIYLIVKDSKYFKESQQLRRLLNKINEPADVILITEAKFNTYGQAIVKSYKNLRIKNYLHENFALIVPKGPLCAKHTILNKEEVFQLLNHDLHCHLINLPKIYIEDVQCIWIGAEVGDVIKIESYSFITGATVHYRVVVAKSGRIVSFRNADIAKEGDADEEEDAVEREDADEEEAEDAPAADVSDAESEETEKPKKRKV